MILIDKPYISDLFRDTIIRNRFPVIDTAVAREMGFGEQACLIDEARVIEAVRAGEEIPLYTTSENAIGWIASRLGFTALPEKIDLFKNKTRFRELTRTMYPEFFFREIRMEDLDTLDITTLPRPFIIKPAVGFFSVGVHKVEDDAGWQRARDNIRTGIQWAREFYPVEVIDTTRFIIEECIEGTEFAVDAYFDADGSPVILSILKHLFSSARDVSDRVYLSSKSIIEANIAHFEEFLREIGRLADLKRFPVHIEVRIDDQGTLRPIEVNPLRFGGWCTTADLSCLAYGFNPYEYYFRQRRPDWTSILADKANMIYALIVLDNSTGVSGDRIAHFDYDRLLETFEHPLELRRIDYSRYPIFGFLFTETRRENFVELGNILTSNLQEFITVRD